MLQTAYFRIIDFLSRKYGQADFVRYEIHMPRIRGWRRQDGLFDVRAAYVMADIGLNNDSNFVGRRPIIQHRESDEIKDKVATEGWFPGAPSITALRKMDGLTLTEQEAEEMDTYHKEVAYRLNILRRKVPEEKKKKRYTVEKIPKGYQDAIKNIYSKERMSILEIMDLTQLGYSIIKKILIKGKIPIRHGKPIRPKDWEPPKIGPLTSFTD